MDEQTRLALMDALADGQWHSGEALAQAAGISRAALAKRVDKLREWQLDVEARQGLGYRLAMPLERLDAARIPAPVPLKILAATDSTNTRLMEADSADDPQALLAEFQSAGRGRRGRAWSSPFGANLYLSLAWSFAAWPRDLPALSLAVGVACARALRRVAPRVAVGLKWPNDLYVQGRKLGGILLEHRGEAGGNCRVVIGVGINVAMRAAQAQAIEQAWVSLDEAAGQSVSRNALASALLHELQALLAGYAESGFPPCADEWAALDLTRDREIRVKLAEGELQGIGAGLHTDGALRVLADGRLHLLHAGDVSVRLT